MCPWRLKSVHFRSGVRLYLRIHMFRMAGNELFPNLMEKNRFVCECISLSSINHAANCPFF